ncbi:hypothetical protein AC578_10836 [Pseudocercospora eumusae]|uniref:Uncharacterized protein n=1 Tax=Pseudocercospora eumusae TaxID=321146 RepID=A0A139H8T1_9PEZI|nr:hypothetical protein AC578_10836 [Pseudocercospora eumusae]
MPPKGAAKVKAADKAPATPEKSKSKARVENATPTKTPSKTPSKTPTKRAATQSVDFTSLPKDSTGPLVPIDVSYEGDKPQSALRNKGIPYGKILKLAADNAFTVEKSIMLTDGEYAGHQAIILRPAKPFDFLNIPDEARTLVYRYYFAAKGNLNDSIVIDGKRSTTKEPYAKTYADGSKQRVALLAVSKEVNINHPHLKPFLTHTLTQVRKEALQIFTALPLRFETTHATVDFFMANSHLRNTVTNIEIKTYQKTSARNALHYLSEVPTLTRLHFETGVSSETDPIKAAKTFWNDGYKFLQAVANRREDKDKTKTLDILSFHTSAFLQGSDSSKPWTNSMLKDFRDALVAKLM